MRSKTPKNSKKVVFLFPAFSSSEATAPLGILAVATPLLRAGYEVSIVDSTITPHLEKRVLAELDGAVCLAVSLVTGPMIRETSWIARRAKELYPDLPVVLGGWHPSLLPDQTLAASCVDVVVRGQGEDVIVELMDRLRARASLAGLEGVGYKEDGQLVFNAERPLRKIVDLPPKAYHLGDWDAYERLCGRRWAMYLSSLACPFDCAYCTNEGVYGRQWNALPAEQTASEMADLVRRYRLKLLWVVDDNFLVDRERAVEVAEGLIREGVEFEWSIQASTNLVTRLSVEQLKLLRRSGLSQICHGAESASPKVLKAMNKTFQKIDTMYAAADRCVQADIRPSFNIIFGYPGEGEPERQETVRFMMDVCRRYPKAEFWTNIFTPYPGAAVMEKATELGIQPPDTFEGWADFFPRYTVLPWLQGKDHHRVQVMRDYLRFAFARAPIAADRRLALTRWVDELIQYPARWRLDHMVFGLPVEVWLKKAMGWASAQRRGAAKPKVDANSLESLSQAG